MANGSFSFISTVSGKCFFESEDIAPSLEVCEITADRLFLGSRNQPLRIAQFAGQTLKSHLEKVPQVLKDFREKQKSELAVSLDDCFIYLRQRAFQIEQVYDL